MPEAERAEATALWEKHRAKVERRSLKKKPPKEEDEERFFILTLQLLNSCAPEERAPLARRAIEIHRIDRFAASLRCTLVRDAARRGDLAEARLVLGECDPNPDHILSDSSYRLGYAHVAIAEGDAEAALTCLGESWEHVTFANAYRVLAGFYRAQALRMAGRPEDAKNDLAAYVATIGVREAESYVDKLPVEWDFDTTGLYGPLRSDRAFDGGFSMVGGVLALGGTVALVAGLAVEGLPANVDDERFGPMVAIPFLFALGAWWLFNGWRIRRIAKEGQVVIGRAAGRIRTMWQSNKRSMYRLRVDAVIDGESIYAESLERFGRDASEEMVEDEERVWVLYHPAYPTRASVMRRKG